MAKRINLRPKSVPISKPALKLQWMIRNKKHPSLSFRRSIMPAGCAAILADHHDVLIEILSRLPVKTLMRFRCVSTTWRSLIANPHFVKKHMKYDAERAPNDNDLRLMFSMKPPSSMGLAVLKGAELAERFRGDRVAVRELEFPVSLDFVKGEDIRIVGSCNGIVCVNVRGLYVLWNPCTGEHNVLPKPSVSCYGMYYGFGYDEINDDYKVVKGSHMVPGVDGWVKPMIQVFSLRRGAWETYPGPENVHMRGQGAFMNGRLHWLWYEEQWNMGSSEIRAFSLAEEKFQEPIPIPWNGIPNPECSIFFNGILICRNRLYVHSDMSAVKILMMKEYGVKESWTEEVYLTYHEVPEIYEVVCKVKPLWIFENGDFLAFTKQRGGFLSLFKSEDMAFRNVIKPEGSYTFEEVIYKETLVSPVTGSLRDI